MKRIDAYMLMGGEVFTSERDAKRRAEKLFADAIESHAHAILKNPTYQGIGDYLHDNAERLSFLAMYKADIELEREND